MASLQNNNDVRNERWSSSLKKISSSPTTIKDARERLQSSVRPRNFPKIVFSENPVSPPQDTNKATLPERTSSSKGLTYSTQTTSHSVDSHMKIQYVESQTDLTVDVSEEYYHCVSRVDPSIQKMEELTPNEALSTITSHTQRLEVSHETIGPNVVATMDQETVTELQENTPLYLKIVPKVMGIGFIAATTRKDRNLKPIIKFVKKRDWDALKFAYEEY